MKILFLANKLPHAEIAGSHRLIYNRMIRLKSLGHQIGIIALTNNNDKKIKSTLNNIFDEVITIPFKERSLINRINDYINPLLPAIFWKNKSNSMMKKIGEIIQKSNYEIIISEFGEMGLYLYRNPYLPAIHKIVSCHRCLTDSFNKYICTSGVSFILKLKCKLQLKRVREYEFEMYNAMDHILTLTNEDRLNILNYSPQLPISVVPPGIDIKELNLSNTAKKPKYPLIVMCGYFDNKSNRDAALWFIKSIWPLIFSKNNKIRCWFIGKGISHDMLKIGSQISNITMIADIDDLRPYRKSASVFINPMRLGSGLRIKILEAMGSGLPVVSTSLGAAGIPVQNGENCFIADTPKEFSDAILWMLKDKKLAQKIGENGKKMVENKYEINKCIKQLESICNDTISLSTLKN